MQKYKNLSKSFFSRFEDGIQLDEEGWYSVTPEKIALHQAEKAKDLTVLDAFCGCGGNTISFAQYAQEVIAVDISPEKIQMAQHNASLYPNQDKIKFLCHDFFDLPPLQTDLVFLSCPWGGPQYVQNKIFELENLQEIYMKAKKISQNIIFFLPRNTNIQSMKKLLEPGETFSMELHYLNGNKRIKAVSFYYGPLFNANP